MLQKNCKTSKKTIKSLNTSERKYTSKGMIIFEKKKKKSLPLIKFSYVRTSAYKPV
jgi:hypothetical protein